MRKLSLSVCVLVLLSGCQSEIKQVEETIVPVQISITRPDFIARYLKLTGGLEAINDAFVYSKITEKVESIPVNPGDAVKESQTLAVQSGRILQQSINLAQAGLESAETQYATAQQDFNRMQHLIDNNAITPQQFEQSESQLKTTRAMVKQAEAQLEQAKEQYQNSIIKSPFAGKVAQVLYEEGQMVSAGQPVVQIINDSQLRAKLFVPAVDIPLVHPGQKVIARFPAIPDIEFTGYIEQINQAVDPTTRALEIEVCIDNNHPLLKSGIFGQFLIETQLHTDTIVLPDNVVLSETEVTLNPDTGVQESVKRYYVYVAEGNSARARDVEIGLYSEGRMEILSGLSVGDSVVVMGQNVLNDNASIEIIAE